MLVARGPFLSREEGEDEEESDFPRFKTRLGFFFPFLDSRGTRRIPGQSRYRVVRGRSSLSRDWTSFPGPTRGKKRSERSQEHGWFLNAAPRHRPLRIPCTWAGEWRKEKVKFDLTSSTWSAMLLSSFGANHDAYPDVCLPDGRPLLVQDLDKGDKDVP